MTGRIYLNSYLRPFDAEALVLNFSIQDKLYYGYLKTVNHWILLLTLAIVIFTDIPILIKELEINRKIDNFFKKFKKNNQNNNFQPIHNESSETSFNRIAKPIVYTTP